MDLPSRSDDDTKPDSRINPAIASRLIGVVAQIKNVDQSTLSFSAEDDFLAMLDFDSLETVNLSVGIASEFGFGFGELVEDLDALANFGSLVSLLECRTRSEA